MPLLVSYTLKNILARKLTSLMTIFGIALVVFVFSAVLMLTHGLGQTLVSTGYDNNVIIIRRASQTEIQSIIPRRMANAAKADPAIKRDIDGTLLIANEILVLIVKNKKSSGEPSNIPVRGVTEISMKIRPDTRIVDGRMWKEGTSEIMVGRKVQQNFEGCSLGQQVKFGGRSWTIVGVMESGGSAFESEIWGDYNQLAPAFDRPIFSSLTMTLNSPQDFDAMKERLENDPRMTVEVKREKQYYEDQSRFTTVFINILGTIISIVFSLGAIVGAMITMYSSVANRTIEIGTLRALGFRRRNILAAFLVESVMIASIGGVLGIAGASVLQFVEVSTTNWDTFAELAFSFETSSGIVLKGMIFAIVMGIVGGFFPAVRASRFRIVNALRAK